MKTKIGLIVLVVLCVGLAIALVTTKKQADDQHGRDASTILDFSNQWSKASINVDELQQVNLTLNSDLATNRLVLTDLSNNLAAVSLSVTNIQNSLQAAEDQVAGQSNRIADLQAQNKALDDRAAMLTQQAVELTNTINSLNGQISDTMKQLAGSQTNNAYLEQQLQQLVEMKAELEHKFNTLQAVRDQVKKLHDELIEARRLEWMKEGTDVPLKGAQLLMRPHKASTNPVAGGGTNYGLDVEIGTDGSVHAISPASTTVTNSATTNAPAH